MIRLTLCCRRSSRVLTTEQAGSGAEDQNTPLQIGDTLYVCTPYSKILPLSIKATGSNAVRADSLHYRSDLMLNGSILLALVLEIGRASCRERV